MSRSIEIRNVPDPVRRTLEARAALAGMSLSDFLLAAIREIAERPGSDELAERLARRSPVDVSESPADAVRRERDAR